MYLNKTTIIGNLTRNPEIKSLPSGEKVANFSLATNRTWKDKQGNKQEEVEYHNCVVFGRQAETIVQYMVKGSQLLIEGRLKTSSWEGAEGKKMYKTEIIVESSQFGNKPSNGTNTQETPNNSTQEQIDANYGIVDDSSPEDIPF